VGTAWTVLYNMYPTARFPLALSLPKIDGLAVDLDLRKRVGVPPLRSNHGFGPRIGFDERQHPAVCGILRRKTAVRFYEGRETLKNNLPTIFDRLQSRGIDYIEIKKLISIDLPHAALFFDTHFGPRTPPQILRQTGHWRKLLSDDFLLSAEQKKDVEKTLIAAEMCAWNALIETSFPRLGAWSLFQHFVPTDEGSEPSRIHPDIRIVAIHEKTREKRVAVVPGGKDSVASWGDAWRKAFTTLGLLDLVLKRTRRKRLVSQRHSQAWPIFTKVVIPRLYDFLAPYYRKRGNVWSAKEKVLQRDAFFSKELLEDMRDILIQEHPDVFAGMSLDQLKAAVHRHITQRRKSTESAK